MEFEARHAKYEKIEVLFQPDMLIAYEYFNHVCKNKSLQPEKRLMLEVLKDAIDCFRKYIVKSRKDERTESCEAEEWIWEEEETWPFSYNNICMEIGLDANGIRKKLMQWKRTAAPGH